MLSNYLIILKFKIKDRTMNVGMIYIIKNTKNTLVYIGQTTETLEDRWQYHIRASRDKHKVKYKLYMAINEYGFENFYCECLEGNIPLSLLDEKEIYYINQYNSYINGYNSTNGGKGGALIISFEDTRNIIESYKEGKNAPEISKNYGVDGSTILRILKLNDVNIRKFGSKLNENMLDDVVDAVKTHTYKEVGEIYNVNEKTIRRFLSKYNIYKRDLI